MTSRFSPPVQWLVLIGASALAEWLLEWANVPGALLLAPMIVAIAFGSSGSTLRLPHWGFLGPQAIVGCLIAGTVSPQSLQTIARDWAPMLAVVALTVVAGGIVGYALARLGALPGTTAAWGSAPGSATAMMAMAEDYGGDVRLVGFMQNLRVLLVVLSVSAATRILASGVHSAVTHATGLYNGVPLAVPLLPFAETLAIAIAGAALALRLRIPAGAMLGPMFIGAVLHATGLVTIALPAWLLAVAYAGIGWYIGLRFTRALLTHVLRAIPQLVAAILALIALCGGSAWLLTRTLHIDGLTAYLATSPGGLDSIAIIAMGTSVNIPFVLAIQTLRLFVVMFTGPQIARLILRWT